MPGASTIDTISISMCNVQLYIIDLLNKYGTMLAMQVEFYI